MHACKLKETHLPQFYAGYLIQKNEIPDVRKYSLVVIIKSKEKHLKLLYVIKMDQ